jgi:hypothetical protein
MIFSTIAWIRRALCVLKKLKNGAKNILRNNITPAALTAWLANHPHLKGSVQALKRSSARANKRG